MPRCPTLLALLAFGLGCGGVRTPPASAVAPSDAPLGTDTRQTTPDSVATTAARQPSQVPAVSKVARDSTSADFDTLAERRLAADSAADEAVLDELASSRPAGADDSTAIAVESPTGEKALTNTVTWDIDVESFADHDRVQYYLDFFGSKGRERMSIWLSRMTRYETMIRERLRKEGLPEDLVYLALIESGFSNSATSRSKAVGMWQFMKGTGKHYGLRVDSWVDERRDPFLATDAAARHLRDLTQRFGSVYLAAAAYNAGAGRVSRGLVRLPEDDDADPLASDATFFRLYDTKLLHRETKDYVPKLIAAARIAKEPARYGFVVDTQPPVVYDSMIVPDMTGLDVIARLADTTVAGIRELNRHFLRAATPPNRRSVVRLPAGRGPSAQLAYDKLPASRRITTVEHAVRSGETLSGIARRYKVSLRSIQDANPKLAKRIRPGQVVIIPTGATYPTVATREVKSRGSASKSTSRVATASTRASTRASDSEARKSKWHRVRRGETLSEIAEDYGVTVGQLRNWNSLKSGNQIQAGQRLRLVPAVSRAAKPSAKQKPKARRA